MKKKNFLRNLSTTTLAMCCLSSSVALPSFVSFEENLGNIAWLLEEEEEIDDDDDEDVKGNNNGKEIHHDKYSNYHLPGHKDPHLPNNGFQSLNQKPMFEHKPSNDSTIFTVPLPDHKTGATFNEYAENIKTIANESGVDPLTANLFLPYSNIKLRQPSPNGTSQDSHEGTKRYERPTTDMCKQSMLSNENENEIIDNANSFLQQDFDRGFYKEDLGPNCKSLLITHGINLARDNPKRGKELFDQCSQTKLYHHIATHLPDYEDENSQASQELKEQLLQDYNEYYPISDFFGEQNKAQRIEERKNCLFKKKINEVKGESAEYWEDQNEGAQNFVEYDTANILADEQFAFNKLFTELESQENAWDEFTSLYE